MGGSKQTQTTKQATTANTSSSGTATRDPWAEATPALQDILARARQYGGNASLFAPSVSGSTMQGIQGLENIAQNPTATQGYLPQIIQGAGQGFDTGNSALMTTASGGMLGGNPYLDAALATAKQNAADSVNAQFSGAGRYGSAYHGNALADRLGAIETNARLQNYDTERARQLNAAGLLTGQGMQGAGLAGQLDNANVAQQQLLLGAGQARDQIDTATKQAPLTATQWMSGLTTPIASLGGTATQSQTGTQTGTLDGTQVTKTPANIPGMVLGGLTTAAGLFGGGGLGGLGSLFGGSQVFNQPGTAANGGWSTTAQTPGWFF